MFADNFSSPEKEVLETIRPDESWWSFSHIEIEMTHRLITSPVSFPLSSSINNAFTTYFSSLFCLNFDDFIVFFRDKKTSCKGCLKHIDEQIIGQDIQFLDLLSLNICRSCDTISDDIIE